MSGTVLSLYYLIILTTLKTKKKKSKIYLSKVTQSINGKIGTQNQDCVTPKSRALSILPDYLNTRLEIRPVTSVSLSKS